MTLPKGAATLMAAACSFLLHAPVLVHKTAGVAVWFVIVDTVTGVACARRAGATSSTEFRNKMKDKGLCFGMILGLFAGIAVMGNNWAWLVAGWWAVMFCEAISISENLRGLLARLDTGGRLAPVLNVLDRGLAFLGVQPNLPLIPANPAAPVEPAEQDSEGGADA
jgi:hypothetical protein